MCLRVAVGNATSVSFFLANGFSPSAELLAIKELPTKANEYIKHSTHVRLIWSHDGTYDRKLALKVAKKHNLMRAVQFIESD